MSRRCPKSNHLFLNWLKNNRSQFLIEPRVTKKYKKTMSGYFAGVTNAIKFFVYRGSHIDVDVSWQGQGLEEDCLAMFLFWEKRWKGGYFSEWLDPKLNNYYATREELWLTECFEPFLYWCNEYLVNQRWVAIYGDEIGGNRRNDYETGF